jgi:SPASM domain peptide maturase of grasp-with-spasm system
LDIYFKLFACCIPVKGFKRSIICDLQRGIHTFIPNGLTEIIELAESLSINELKENLSVEDGETFDEYIKFLIDNEYAFYVTSSDKEHFPKLNMDWERPQIITNSVIDHDACSDHNYEKIVQQLNTLGCQAVELRFFNIINLKKIRSTLSFFNRSRIRTLNIIIPYCSENEQEDMLHLFLEYPRLLFIVVHGAKETQAFEDNNSNGKIFYVPTNIDSAVHCGIVDSSYFNVNIDFFLEAQKFNTCLNKKIAIDQNGFIRNCPSGVKKYGHHKQTLLIDVINTLGFKDAWSINKDEILVCRDYEFRYICSDCRVFIEDPHNIYSKPAKCKYDPYSATWDN